MLKLTATNICCIEFDPLSVDAMRANPLIYVDVTNAVGYLDLFNATIFDNGRAIRRTWGILFYHSHSVAWGKTTYHSQTYPSAKCFVGE